MIKKCPLPRLLFAACSILLASCARQIIAEVSPADESKVASENRGHEDEAEGPQEAISYEFEITKDPALNDVPKERLLDVYRYIDEYNASGNRSAISGVIWQERGPANVGGRTRALIFDLNDATYNTVWAGGVGGGLWKTTNISAATPTWVNVGDLFGNIAITTLAQDPTNYNVMYMGTGEGWYNADAIRGNGIWKTTDGGTTWSQLSSTTGSTFYYVNKIVVDNSGNVYATTRGGGLQKSTDGGTTWTKVLGNGISGGNTDEMGDVVIGSNGDIYCSSGNVFIRSKLFKSVYATHGTNTGNVGNWSTITLPAGGYRRIEIALAPTDTNRVYLIWGDSATSTGGFLTSADKGASWSARTFPTTCDQGSTSEFTRGQWWYDLSIKVDPTNANTLYVGAINYARSTNNGTTWTQLTDWAPGFCGTLAYMHSDHHIMAFKPGSSTTCVFGEDGGIYYSSNIDAASPTISIKNQGYNVTQYYGCDLNPTSGSNNFIAGAQDNGSSKFNSAGINNITSVSGGDGCHSHIDQDNGDQQISSYVYNNYYVTTNNWSTSTAYGSTGGSFVNPTDFDDANNLLYCYNGTGTYKTMSTTGTFSTNKTYGASYGSATVIKVSPNVSNCIYVGTSTGNVVRCTSSSGTPVRFNMDTLNSLPSGSILCIEIRKDNSSPFTDDTLMVTFSNFGLNSVWMCTNGSATTPTWTSIEGNLPDMPVRYALFAPGGNADQALLATDVGVWSTTDINGSLTDWAPTNTGLANVSTVMLKTRTSDNLIIAATHGRGLYSTNKYAPFNKMGFQTASQTLDESSATTGLTCRKYTDVSIPVEITKPGSANITLNVSANVLSSATPGVDYDLLSSSVTFTPSATTLSGNIVLRLYNDDLVENTDSLLLDISTLSAEITGTTIAQHKIYITSEDADPSTSATVNATIGTGTITNNLSTPFRGNFEDERYQLLLTSTELGSAGLVAGNIHAITLNIVKNSTAAYQGYTIKLGHTTSTTLSTFLTPTFTTVYSANYTTTNGLNTITFTTPFNWDGTSNVVIEFCYNNPNGSSPGGIDYVYCNSTVDKDMFNRANSSTGCTLAASFQNDVRPNVILKQIKAAVVQTAVNTLTADEQYIGPNQTVYFYDNSSGNVLAKIENLSTHDFGCTKVEVTRAGSLATNFWYTTASTRAADKTYKVTPTNNDTTAAYNISFYFEEYEVDGWMATTLHTDTSFNIIKVKDHEFAAVTPSTPYASDVIVNYGTTKTFHNSTKPVFTAGFTGFSSFGFGSPGAPPAPLPVELLSFNGQFVHDQIKLTWTTLTEINNEGFHIERSIDGENFTAIGFVKGAGNSYKENLYELRDEEKLAPVHYYRLKQVDFNGNFKYSNVIAVQLPGVAVFSNISPNPASGSFILSFPKTSFSTITVGLYNTEGRLVADLLSSIVVRESYSLKIPESVVAGIYYVHITTDDETVVKKLIKE